MWLLKPLDDILSSGAKVKILRAMALAPAPHNGREISRRAGTDPGYTSRVLAELVASGVVAKREQGRVNTYRITDECLDLIDRLIQLFAAESERSERAIGELARALPEARSIILYGSEARGEAEPGSDTDILIVFEQRTADLDDMVADACLKLAERYSLSLSWHVADVARMREWEVADNDFWRNVQRDGVTLAGDSIERLRHRWLTGRAS
ncbi:MAG: nucleotidyltransferase domain-containing protein [Armatimonadota bacterium]|jgi:predicted nucleotidyltransferase/predicted transcriptional regulator